MDMPTWKIVCLAIIAVFVAPVFWLWHFVSGEAFDRAYTWLERKIDGRQSAETGKEEDS